MYLSREKEISIAFALRNTTKDFATIAKDHKVKFSTVGKIFNQHRLRERMREVTKGVYGNMSKTEAYNTEREMLENLPQYQAGNKHLLTPINKDWKLF